MKLKFTNYGTFIVGTDREPCHTGAAIRDLILVPRCIAERHLLPGLLTIVG
jgi:hypothetical protein